VITLGSRSFCGPYMAPLWTPPKAAAVYAVLAPGWRLLTFRALDFDQTQDLSCKDLLRRHPKYAEWLRIVGTEWNLYVATHEISLSTEAQREAMLRQLARDYRPEFKPLAKDIQ
jgi:inactivated superfamily I helicase